ncbi:MAG: efflux RND transporter permease subunit [Cyanothece sp. SIO2G6]|nr:efflux RND transporter permease subunit [Cyanothece sp. SIO2G6]
MKTEERSTLPPEVMEEKASETVSKLASEQASPLMRFFFTRQIFGTLLCFLLLMGGLLGYFGMVKEGDPDINIARALITTAWPGTDAETIETQVTEKIEEEIKTLQGLDDFTSATFNSFSIINIDFVAEAPVEASISKLRSKVDDADSELPSESTGREEPNFEQLSQQDAPVLTMAIYGEGLDVNTLSQAAENLQDELESVTNVREVDLLGYRENVIHVQMRPSRLTSLGIAATQVSNAIQDGNTDRSWDLVRDDAIGAQARFYGRPRTVEDLKRIPVARLDENRVVRLAEVADVYKGLEREESRAFVSLEGDEFVSAITLEVVKVSGTDTIQVVEDALAFMEDAKANNPELWPVGMEYRVLTNDAESIRGDLFNLGSNVLQASLCVFAVLFVALTWREALIAGLAIPVTFAGAIFVIWMMGYTLNTMVMIGMILALGLLVDVFILMLEGLHDGIFVKGLSFPDAAITTVKTYSGSAFAGQLTTILAMAPLMAISGTMGKFVRLIPISAITCLVLSFTIALLAVVPLSKFLLGNVQGENQQTAVDRLTEKASAKFAAWSLKNTVPNRTVARLWTLGTLGLFVFSCVLFTTLPFSLFPQEEGEKLSINVEMPPSTTLERSQQAADRIGELLRSYTVDGDHLLFDNITKLVGQRSNLVESSELKPESADYFLGMSAVMVPRSERVSDSATYVPDLREALQTNVIDDYPGAIFALQYERAGDDSDAIQVEIYGEDMLELRRISAQVQEILRNIPGTMDVRDDLGNLRTDYKLVPRREALDFYGISHEELSIQGRYLMIDNDIGDYPIGSGEDDIEIRLSTRWPSQGGAIGGPSRLDEFATMRFINNQGESIAASSLIERVDGTVPLAITHRDTMRSVTVMAKPIPQPDIYDTEILAELATQLDPLVYDPSLSSAENQAAGHWPRGYSYRFGGDADTSGETFASAGQMLIVAVFLVFSLLVLQFTSYTQPIIIILTILFALIGTFTGFFLLNMSFSFPAAIGVISLIGIVVNDAIVMVDTMNAKRRAGLDVRQAAAEGASDRLRPILTTTTTTIIGLLPLAFSEAKWFPLCMAIIFGLLTATFIALLVVPGLYLQLTPKTTGVEADETTNRVVRKLR